MKQILIQILQKIGIEPESGTLIEIPNEVIIASTLLSISAISQWLVDLLFEAFAYAGVINEIPFRINFITLTFLSALLAYQTFIALEKKNLKITKNALQVGILVEIGLIIGDIIFLRGNPGDTFLLWFRLPFIFLTAINAILIMFIWHSIRDKPES